MTDPREKIGQRSDPFWVLLIATLTIVAVVGVVVWGAYKLGYDAARDRYCTHGESSVVFENGKQSEPVTSGCTP